MATRSVRPHNGGQKRGLRPLMGLREDMERLFDNWFNEPLLSGLKPLETVEERVGMYVPRVDITENDKTIKITAELPGVEEKNLDISLTDDTLILKGEKSEETKGEEKNYRWQERFYGSFQREIPLSCEVEADQVKAHFKNGILSITLPKTAKAKQKVRKINVKGT